MSIFDFVGGLLNLDDKNKIKINDKKDESLIFSFFIISLIIDDLLDIKIFK